MMENAERIRAFIESRKLSFQMSIEDAMPANSGKAVLRGKVVGTDGIIAASCDLPYEDQKTVCELAGLLMDLAGYPEVTHETTHVETAPPITEPHGAQSVPEMDDTSAPLTSGNSEPEGTMLPEINPEARKSDTSAADENPAVEKNVDGCSQEGKREGEPEKENTHTDSPTDRLFECVTAMSFEEASEYPATLIEGVKPSPKISGIVGTPVKNISAVILSMIVRDNGRMSRKDTWSAETVQAAKIYLAEKNKKK